MFTDLKLESETLLTHICPPCYPVEAAQVMFIASAWSHDTPDQITEHTTCVFLNNLYLASSSSQASVHHYCVQSLRWAP